MAGKRKTVEYFPHLLKDSTTIRALEMLYGHAGYSTWFKLLEVLGSNAENNYKYEAKTKEQCNYLLDKFKIDGKLMAKILNTLCELNAIDKDMWKNKRILYVPNLINNIQKMRQKVNANTNLIEKENKQEDKNKDKKLYLEYVYLKDEEYKKLVEKYSEKSANDWIERVNNWIAENPKEKKRQKDSHYHTILNWDRRNNKNENNVPQKKPQYRDLSSYKVD